jgi:AcrR family transcriptional regulator
MGEKAEYKSAIRSRRLIRQAFIELMKEKELEKITVTDIVKRADINRGTFYAHYKYTRAVIEQIENEIIERDNQSVSTMVQGRNRRYA